MADKRTVKTTGTGRKRAESESLKQERLTESCRTLVESSSDSMYIVDRRCRYLFANRHHLERRGKTLEEMVGKPYWGFDRPEHNEEFTAKVKEVLATDKSIQFDHPAHTDPGRHILQTFSPIKDRNGKITAVAIVSKDITKRKQMEEALNETLSLLRTTLDSTADGILVVDKERKVQTCNRRFTEMWRIPKSLAQPHDDNRLFAYAQSQLEDPEGFLAKVQELYVRPRAKSMDELHFKDGRIFERYSQPQRKGGKITGRVWSFRDVTRRRQAEYLYTTLVNNSPIGIYVAQDGKFQYANPQFQKNAGSDRAALVGKETLHLVHPDDREMVRQNAILMLKGMAATPYTFRTIRKNGEIGWILETVVSITYKGGRATLGSHIDITEQTKTEEALQQSEERYRTIIEDIEDGYYEVDPAGNFTFCNEAALKILGFGREEIIGTNCSRYVDSQNAKKLFRTFNTVYKTGVPARGSEWELTRKDGKRRTIEVSVSLIRDAGGRAQGFRGIFRDTTERKKAEETIRHLAYHDALTGLPNRLLFQDRLTVALANAKRSNRQLALLMLDLDEFKEVNDKLGHHMGDILLREVGERLTGLLRGSDTIARLGGDEFMLLVPEIPNAEDYMVIAGKIVAALHDPFLCNGRKIRITTSIGIAIYPHHGGNAGTLMKHADIAMYRAKKKGKDNFQIYT